MCNKCRKRLHTAVAHTVELDLICHSAILTHPESGYLWNLPHERLVYPASKKAKCCIFLFEICMDDLHIPDLLLLSWVKLSVHFLDSVSNFCHVTLLDCGFCLFRHETSASYVDCWSVSVYSQVGFGLCVVFCVMFVWHSLVSIPCNLIMLLLILWAITQFVAHGHRADIGVFCQWLLGISGPAQAWCCMFPLWQLSNDFRLWYNINARKYLRSWMHAATCSSKEWQLQRLSRISRSPSFPSHWPPHPSV